MRKLLLAALVTAAAAAPFASPASATVCKTWSAGGAYAGACDEDDYWLWCAGAGAAAAGGVSFCQYENRPGIWMGCWTPSGLHCN